MVLRSNQLSELKRSLVLISVCPVQQLSVQHMFYVYILESKIKKFRYVGYTCDLKKRLVEHNAGMNKSTNPHKPLQLIYYEACINKNDAKRREKYLKTTNGNKFMSLRLKEYYSFNKISRRISAES